MLYALSILPIFIYLGVLIALDSFSLVRWRRLLLCIGCGALSCFAAFILFESIEMAPGLQNYIVPVLEEFLKGIAVLILFRHRRIAFAIDAAIYGAAVGGGFALLENILYILLSPGMAVDTAVFRGLGTAIMHMGLTATAGVLLVMASRKISEPLVAYIPALIPSILLHFLFNRFMINPFIMLVSDIVCLTAIFAILFSWNRKSIYRWLDNTMNSDSRLLAAMKKGEFSATPSGQYLLSVKEHFHPEVFFDMYCYVKIYLELSLAAKRNLMLSEAGIAVPAEDFRGSIAEYRALRKRIGKTGEIALSPIVRTRDFGKCLQQLL